MDNFDGVPFEDRAEYAILARKFRDIEMLVQEHEFELDTLFSAKDWLGVYHSAVKEHDLNMDFVHWKTSNPEVYKEELQHNEGLLSKLNTKYKTKSLEWDQFAEYSGFLEGVFTGRNTMTSQDQSNYEKTIQFMAVHDKQE